MPNVQSIRVLSDLLRGARAEPILTPERVAPSTIYDLQYRTIVNACVFEQNAKPYLLGPPRVQAARQKLI